MLQVLHPSPLNSANGLGTFLDNNDTYCWFRISLAKQLQPLVSFLDTSGRTMTTRNLLGQLWPRSFPFSAAYILACVWASLFSVFLL
jgi:hypothetical protein